MIIESLQNDLQNDFYQMPYQSSSIARSEVIDKTTWNMLSAVKLGSRDFMVEMFVRQKTISPCDDLTKLPDGELLRIGNMDSKFLKFNKKSGNIMSISFNGGQKTSNDFIFRQVFIFFLTVSEFIIGGKSPRIGRVVLD